MMETIKPCYPGKAPNLAGAFLQNLFLLLSMIFIAWVLWVVDWVTRPFFHLNLDQVGGIHPLEPSHLHAIVTAHWLHGGLDHIMANTGPFFLLGGFVLIGGRTLFWKVTTFVALTGGSLLWLLGGIGNNHIGASLVIFGYLGFLLSRGVFEKSPLWIAISLVTLFLYGGMIFGILPGHPEISWQGHCFGFLSGVFAARLFVPRNRSLYRVAPPLPSLASAYKKPSNQAR